jgi:FkbM family methyltransferase
MRRARTRWGARFRRRLARGDLPEGLVRLLEGGTLGGRRFEMRPGVAFRVHPRAVDSFSVFREGPADLVEEMDAFIRDTRGHSCLLDVGAFHGVFSLVFAATGGKAAYAVEPSPPAFRTLEYNVRRNPDLPIVPVQLALADAPDTSAVSYIGDSQYVRLSSRAPASEGGIEVDTVDRLAHRVGVDFDAVKIDVEGLELSVLRGSRDLLQRTRPVLFLEVHPDYLENQGDSVEALVAYLHGTGYAFYESNESPIPNPVERLTRPLHGHRTLTREVTRVVCRPNG